uniref:GG24806 n=2 Tax=Drosophila erecta TaxID=7220 RepID=B3NZU2_DROER
MRCESLVTMLLLLNILLTSTANPAQRNDPRFKPASIPCKTNIKASQVACKAAKDAKDAKDAQPGAAEVAGQRARAMLADRALQAAKAAEAALNGKKQLLDELTKSLAETKGVIEEIQRAIAASSCSSNTTKGIRNQLRKSLAFMQSLLQEMSGNLDNIRRVALSAQKEAAEKRSLLEAAKRRVEELHNCMSQAQIDLERNRESAKKASEAAREAQQRIETVQKLVTRIKMLKRKDLQSLESFLRRRRRSNTAKSS